MNSKNILILFTGIPNSGKTTSAKKFKEIIKKEAKGNIYTSHIDTDDIRKESKDLGYSDEDRKRLSNILVNKLNEEFIKIQNKHIVFIVSGTLSLKEYRNPLRNFASGKNFLYYEVFLDISICSALQRDKKKLFSESIEKKYSLPIFIKEEFDYIRDFSKDREFIQNVFPEYDCYEPPDPPFIYMRNEYTIEKLHKNLNSLYRIINKIII